LCPSALSDGHAKGFAQLGIFVLRYQGAAHAYRDACPHYGNTPLAWRQDAYLNADGSRIVCAAHGAQFEPDTGLCVLGPCLGQSLQAVPLTINAEGDLVLSALQFQGNDQ
jgi:nitrite reductase/ring-hydroxylating ferredoxin subunit